MEEERPWEVLRSLLTQNELAVVLRIVDNCFNAQTVSQLLSAWRVLDKILAADIVIGVLAWSGRGPVNRAGVSVVSTRPVTCFETCIRKLHATYGRLSFNSLLAENGARVVALAERAAARTSTDALTECLRAIGGSHCVVSTRTTERLACTTAHIFAGESLLREARSIPIIDYLAPHFHSALLRIGLKELMPIKALSSREKEVLRWISAGKTTWEMSKILCISERTVIFHTQNAMKKLGATSRAQAIALALQHGLLQNNNDMACEPIDKRPLDLLAADRSRASRSE